MLLHKVPGGELKDVATVKLIKSTNRTMHYKPMDDAVMRVELGRVLGVRRHGPFHATSESRRAPDPIRLPWLSHDLSKDPDSYWVLLHRCHLGRPAAKDEASCCTSRRRRHHKPSPETRGSVCTGATSSQGRGCSSTAIAPA